MTIMGRQHLSIDVTRYVQLPPDVRVRFDGWLESESLLKERIVRLTLAEGEVIAERIAVDEDGRIIVDESGTDVVLETVRFPVATLPPQAAFRYKERDKDGAA